MHQITYGPNGDIARFHASFLQRCNGAGPALSGEVMFEADDVTPALVSFVDAELAADQARLTWLVDSREAVAVERRTGPGPWTEVARLLPDGSGRIVYEDRQVTPGERVGYRIGIVVGGVEQFLAEQWVEIPLRAALALRRVWPNPAVSELNVSFTLADRAPATIELMDVAGRRVSSVEVGAMGPGAHRVTLAHVARMPAGIYTVRLRGNGRSLMARVCVAR